MTAQYRIDAMDCSAEEAMIRSKLGAFQGVSGLEFNLVQRVLTVHHSLADLEPVVEALKSLSFEPVALGDQALANEVAAPKTKGWVVLVLAALAAIGAEVASALGAPFWVPLALAVVAVAISGWRVYWKGWISVANLSLNINALMSIAVTGAVILQLWPEAAAVMVLFSLAERIEEHSLDRARKAVSGLLSLTPPQATVRQSDGSWTTMPSADVAGGALVRVRPGEHISHDGTVVAGTSTVDQAPITGESLPAEKGVGDPVYAGTVNQHGELEFKVTAPATDSTLARIIHLVEEAQASRAPTQRWVDGFSQIYTPTVVALAVLVAIVPPLLGLGGWNEWIYKALVLLVIACPCALVISTPVTIVSALAAAAKAGILIKGGAALEAGRKLDTIAFDKTGTLTHGRPALTDFVTLSGATEQARLWAAALASRSDHPVSQALAQPNVPLEVAGFEAVAGRGVRGTVGGQALLLGNSRWMEEQGLSTPELRTALGVLEEQGKTTVVLAGTQALAVFGVADTLRASSRDTLGELHELGLKTLLISGDSEITVARLARELGMEARGSLLPQDKLAVLQELSAAGKKVGMVGDGINDAPALARADLGFAMGGVGSGTAIEAADVVLMDDDLRKVAHFLRLSRRTSVVLVQNITLALVLKAVFFGLTVAGLGTMAMAVFADVGTSLLVVFNGLRLLESRRRATIL